MNIIVTGGTGQLGSAFRQLLPEAQFPTRAELDLTWETKRIYGTIQRLLSSRSAPMAVIHCAAYTAVDQAQTDTATATQVNFFATGAIAQACQDLKAKLIYYSTDYVFEGQENKPLREDDSPNPQSIYGITKWLGEHAVQDNCSEGSIVRISYVFGDGNNLIKAILNRAREGQPLRGVTDQLLRPSYAPDVAAATVQLLQREQLPPLLHLQNSGDAVSVYDLARRICTVAGLDVEITPVTLQQYNAGRSVAPRPQYSVFDLSLATSLGITMPTWEDALQRYLTNLS